MATTTLPQRRAGGSRRGRWLAAGAAVLVLAVIAGVLVLRSRSTSSAATTATATTAVATSNVIATVSGSGSVAAAQALDLPFQTSGTVTKVLVQAGDTVEAGQVLAQLDTRDLDLQVASAQAQLEAAKLKLGQTEQAEVQPADLQAQQASVASARAQLASAQAQLAALRNPTAAAIGDAESAIQQAQITLQATRDSSSAAKTRAEQDLQKATAALTQAQSRYSTALQNWEHVRDRGTDPTSPTKTDASGKTKPNSLNDAQRQAYYDAYVQAEAALQSAETGVQQAQVSYDSARQSEITNVQQAEAKLADAERQLAALKNPNATDLAQKQASVAQAKAGLDQAEANLAKLTAPGTSSDIAIQNASVTQAEQALAQAQLKHDMATLKAPFAGVVTAVNIVPGSTAGSSSAAVSLIDRSTLHVDLKLSENDVAKVALDQPVTLTIDALKGWQADGTVTYIAPSAESSNGVVTYAVRVSFPDGDARVKVGMTANLTITVNKHDNVLVVPSSALLPKGAGHVVQVRQADGTLKEVEVETGLTDGLNTEIVSGLKAGDQVVTTPSTVTSSSQRRGPFGGP